jgi:hypothetical protein
MTDDAIKIALQALVLAYRARHAPAADATDDAVVARYVLQQIQNPDGAKDLGASLEDKPGEIAIAPSLLIALIQSALSAKELERRLADSEREANEAWGAIYEAHRIMSSKSNGSTSARQSEALKRLGLLKPPRNKGTVKPMYREAANLYYLLRCGGLGHVDGALQQIEPHSHDEAVLKVERFARINWDELARAWRRYGIEVRTEAEVFPISTVKVRRPPVK